MENYSCYKIPEDKKKEARNVLPKYSKPKRRPLCYITSHRRSRS